MVYLYDLLNSDFSFSTTSKLTTPQIVHLSSEGVLFLVGPRRQNHHEFDNLRITVIANQSKQ